MQKFGLGQPRAKKRRSELSIAIAHLCSPAIKPFSSSYKAFNQMAPFGIYRRSMPIPSATTGANSSPTSPANQYIVHQSAMMIRACKRARAGTAKCQSVRVPRVTDGVLPLQDY